MPLRRPLAAAVATLLLVLTVPATGHAASRPGDVRQMSIGVVDGPHHDRHVRLDAALYLPAHTPAPAVIVSPGFGGSKKTVAGQARDLADRGFVVLAYTPRGFGNSTGRIALNSPDYEVTDARQLVDWLARQPEVRKDAPGDPRVGVTGASYGGALSLLLAGTDPRVDALAPVITYNDLAQALLPDSATRSPLPGTPAPGAFATGHAAAGGVFKRAWAGYFFASGLGGSAAGGDPTCGRFMPAVCRAYQEVATDGVADQATVNLLRHNSPATVTAHITAPTLLVQGTRDTLFGLAQADANARQIHAAGGTVKVMWYSGGHDGGEPGKRVEDAIGEWFSFHLAHRGTDPGTGFSYQVAGTVRRDGSTPVRTVTVPSYPGLAGGDTHRRALSLSGGPQPVLNPAGGNPAALSSMPGTGAVPAALAGRLAHDVPGEFARFATPELAAPLLIAGAPVAHLEVSGPPGAVLFAKLYDVAPDGTRTLPGGAVAPFRIPAGGGGPITVTLPGIVHATQAGHHLELVVASTDQAYAGSSRAAVYRVDAQRALSVPIVSGHSFSTTPFPTGQLIAIAAVLLLALLAGGWLLLRRGRPDRPDPDLAGVPLALDSVSKRYRTLTVVDGLSFQVRRGQVLGLLGPNGAGKTTALRVLLGLVTPTTGEVRIFGHRVRPGAPVLSRVGSFVERPGFLPHLSGLANLRLFWRATGRPESEARLEEALTIADLGDALHRRVGTYSLGMRQRLAIAQAMLGMPDLLVLDEPTNGLDPPQIRDTRDLLLRYARTGRTVLVSSHVLAEVEQTCDHVVVMNRGKLVAAGATAELIEGNGESVFAVDHPQRAAAVLGSLDGTSAVRTDDHTVYARLADVDRADAVAALVAAGVRVQRAGPHGRLEDAFLALVEEQELAKQQEVSPS